MNQNNQQQAPKKHSTEIVLPKVLEAFVTDMAKQNVSFTIGESSTNHGKREVTVTTTKYLLKYQEGNPEIDVTDRYAKLSTAVKTVDEMRAFCC